MLPPPHAPPRVRSDLSNPFANHTMRVRVPAILERVIQDNPAYAARVKQRIAELARSLRDNRPLPELPLGVPESEGWREDLQGRSGERWLQTDWFFAETYAYRCLIECVDFWSTASDPFLGIKQEETLSRAHALAFEATLVRQGNERECLSHLLAAALFGNRMDLSFAASLERGMSAEAGDLLIDDREAAISRLLEGEGPLHVICDNAGTELSMDLALSDFVLERLGLEVVLHVKLHPTFVSDATLTDVHRFLRYDGGAPAVSSPALALPELGRASLECLSRLRAALQEHRLRVEPHAFWNGPRSSWELPDALVRRLESARLVILKGDANYRRALGDALWPPDTPFSEVTAYFPAPLLALRTLKSDPVVGLAKGEAETLDRLDPTWRVNGKRAVASLGGTIRR